MHENGNLAADLRQRALCHTDHPADAASALLLAAGEILHAEFGATGTLALMRAIIDDTEAALMAVHGRQDGEAVQ